MARNDKEEKERLALEHKIGFDGVRGLVSQACLTSAARTMAEQMSMLTDFNAVSAAVKKVNEMLSTRQADERVPFEGYDDIDELVVSLRIPGTFLAEAGVAKLRKALGAMLAVESYFNKDADRFPLLRQTCEPLTESRPAILTLCKLIDKILDKDGQVKDTASPELAEIRSRLRSLSGRISSIMHRVISQAISEGLIDSDVTPAMRDGRLVIPVSPMNKRKIPGIVHDESATGKTVYLEPSQVVEASNRVREAELEQKREVARILAELSDQIRPEIPTLNSSSQVMTELDFINAKASVAQTTGGVLPNLSSSPELEWYHACHPMLALSLKKQKKEIVPINITLTQEKRILVISGPNAGGKSVCLKTVGVIQYMLQCGLLPPVYENSHMGIFDRIMVDIGDDQSIEDDLSTYSSHLRNMKFMLQHGDKRSLFLIDEFGSGTEPQIGGAIAQALLTEFNQRGMWGVVTTHYQNLKQLASETPGLENASMLYDRHLMQPMFQLSIGNPGSSFALEIARKTGLPESIISQASEIVGSDYVNLDNYLLDITRDRRYWENKRQAIRVKEKKLEQQIAKYTEDAEALRTHRREIIEEAKQQAQQIIDSSNSAIERTIHDIRQSQAEREKTLEARRKLREEKLASQKTSPREHELLKKAPRQRKVKTQAPVEEHHELHEGDNVTLQGSQTVGTILSIDGKEAMVSFGNLKTRTPLSRLKYSMKKATSVGLTSQVEKQETRDTSLNFRTEIDMRGMRLDDALTATTYFIDDAIRLSVPRVRILHGTGTGALRQGIRQLLSTTPGVMTFHDEDVRFGGAGITVVELN